MNEGKNLSHYALHWAIVILLALILIILIFKVGIMVGQVVPKYSKCNYTKNVGEHMAAKTITLKSLKSDFANYREVFELTDTGFKARGAKSDIVTVVVNEDTEIYRGTDKDGEVKVGDKVYVDGDKNDSGLIVAEIIKIYTKDFEIYKK